MLTVVIPYVDSDKHLMERAAASVAAQTIPTVCIPVHDTDHHGPQWGRNQGLAQASTPFVTWLDADDTLEPAFAERTLAAYRRNHYVYTDYYRDGFHHRLPPHQITGPVYGVVTRVVRTSTARTVGGFNERLRRLEDTEFWLRVRNRGVCGIHIREALMTYTSGGVRSNSHRDRDALRREIKQLYWRYNMGCCGGELPQAKPANEPQAGDVLARAMWGGNRSFTGVASGRAYPRSGNGKKVWVSPRDLDAMPQLEAVKTEATIEEPPVLDDKDDMTKDDLIELANYRGVEVKTRWSKSEIIEALNEAGV